MRGSFLLHIAAADDWVHNDMPYTPSIVKHNGWHFCNARFSAMHYGAVACGQFLFMGLPLR